MDEVSASELLAAFDSDSGIAGQVKSALISGAPFEIWLKPQSASMLRGILRGRLGSSQRRGKSIIGAVECLADLAERGERGLLLASVDDRKRGGYLFRLFLDPQPLKVVGCVGIGPSPEDESRADPA
ncbi:hypothetical protein [Streptomyces sp. MBT53]|uniref:hypothetical protein n=1 Tax=Streptomyces sp. MBT53 TaxID=1488384 RepID=UPI00191183E0|nr:hypothetical protein [Streptomyces sp. MBT53]MBK6011768.1 hypothetical protein [Streptomyces sp. MBT53]